MKKAGIQEVQDGVFDAAYILIDFEPVIGFIVKHGAVVTGRCITRVVPR